MSADAGVFSLHDTPSPPCSSMRCVYLEVILPFPSSATTDSKQVWPAQWALPLPRAWDKIDTRKAQINHNRYKGQKLTTIDIKNTN